MRKKGLVLIIAIILVLTACSSGNSGNTSSKNSVSPTASAQPSGNKKLKIGFTVANLSNPYFVDLSEGVKVSAKELGYEVTIHDGKADVVQQVNAIENFIQQKMDVIVIAPVDEKALEPVVKKAQEAGIRVISSNQKVEGSDAFITVPEYAYGLAIGEIAGKWVADKLKGEAEVVILDYPELKTTIERANAMRDGILKNAPKAKIVANLSANTVEKGMRAMESILQAHPNIKVVAASNDAGALGAFEAVKAAKKNSEDFFIGGLDATQEALNKIKENGIYRATVDIDPRGMGKLIVDTAVKVIKDGPIKDTIGIAMRPVTVENVDKFIR